MYALFSKLQDLRGRDQKGEAFIELLLIAWEHLPSSDKKKWKAQAQEVDDAEFTVLLDEEWEELSAKNKEDATNEARGEIKKRAALAAALKNEASANADAGANIDLPLEFRGFSQIEQTTTATDAATADKKVWARNKKAWAKDMAIKEAQKDFEWSKRNIAEISQYIVRGVVKSLNSTPQSVTNQSEAFRDKVRVACRCAVSGRLCLATDYRSLAL